MKRISVESSNLRSIGYDVDAGKLEVEFKGGEVYEYSRISPQVWDNFLSASSKGKFFALYLRSLGGRRIS